MIDITKPQKEYELLDSGEGEKLERFGAFVLRRPDPQALWSKLLSPKEWSDASTSFMRSGNAGKWQFKEGVPKEWEIEYGGLKLNISPTPFKHVGVFPEQIVNWKWSQEQIKKTKNKDREIVALNLFGYTGGATLALAQAGAQVCHVDASKTSITWARDNAESSGLKDAPIRWILDDAYEFVKKEIKRGKKYDCIIMDPPAFGHGPNGEVWKIEEQFIRFLEDVKKLLSDDPILFLVNGYASGYSSIAYKQNLTDLVEKYGGVIEDGELAIEEKGSGRLLPSGIFARWSK
ncbi:MAG: class I SAM-dependent methyltransferase [Patescibacteria group bacterium]